MDVDENTIAAASPKNPSLVTSLNVTEVHVQKVKVNTNNISPESAYITGYLNGYVLLGECAK